MVKRPKTAKVNFDTRELEREVQQDMERRVGLAVQFVIGRTKKLLNRGQPTRITSSGRIIGLDPSAPGTSPKKVTSQLFQSITGKVLLGRNKVIGRVGTNLEKGKHLEFGTRKMKKRPFLRPALLNSKDEIRRILGL